MLIEGEDQEIPFDLGVEFERVPDRDEPLQIGEREIELPAGAISLIGRLRKSVDRRAELVQARQQQILEHLVVAPDRQTRIDRRVDVALAGGADEVRQIFVQQRLAPIVEIAIEQHIAAFVENRFENLMFEPRERPSDPFELPALAPLVVEPGHAASTPEMTDAGRIDGDDIGVGARPGHAGDAFVFCGEKILERLERRLCRSGSPLLGHELRPACYQRSRIVARQCGRSASHNRPAPTRRSTSIANVPASKTPRLPPRRDIRCHVRRRRATSRSRRRRRPSASGRQAGPGARAISAPTPPRRSGCARS